MTCENLWTLGHRPDGGADGFDNLVNLLEFCKQTHHAEDAEDSQLLDTGVRFKTGKDGEEACYHNHCVVQVVAVATESNEVSNARKARKARNAREYLRRTGGSRRERSHRTSLQEC